MSPSSKSPTAYFCVACDINSDCNHFESIISYPHPSYNAFYLYSLREENIVTKLGYIAFSPYGQIIYRNNKTVAMRMKQILRHIVLRKTTAVDIQTYAAMISHISSDKTLLSFFSLSVYAGRTPRVSISPTYSLQITLLLLSSRLQNLSLISSSFNIIAY